MLRAVPLPAYTIAMVTPAASAVAVSAPLSSEVDASTAGRPEPPTADAVTSKLAVTSALTSVAIAPLVVAPLKVTVITCAPTLPVTTTPFAPPATWTTETPAVLATYRSPPAGGAAPGASAEP